MPLLHHAIACLLCVCPVGGNTLAPRAPATNTHFNGDEPSTNDLAERAAERILVLEDGRTLRGRTRQHTSGRWELARGRTWLPLDHLGVRSWRLEKDVVADYEARRRALGRNVVPVPARLELAHWCEGSGLVVEALEQLDAALEACPGDALVERHLDRFGERVTLSFGLPAAESYTVADERARNRAVKNALLVVSRLSPAGRHLAGAQLVREATWELVAVEVGADLRRSGPNGRRLACELIGRFAPGEETKLLYVRALLDTSEDVRTAGARALGRVDEPGLVAPIERALYSRDPRVQLNAAQALGAMAQPAALPIIARAVLAPPTSGQPAGPRAHVLIGRQYAYVQDFDVEVATAASIADPQIGVLVEGSVLEARVLSTTIERTVIRKRLIASAERLLGRDLGDKPSEWEAWATAQLAEPAPAPPSTPSSAPSRTPTDTP